MMCVNQSHANKFGPMTKLRLFIAATSLLLSKGAVASMVWAAVALEPSDAAKLRKDVSLVEKLLDEPQKGRSVYLDKAWHGIHYLLTGSERPTQAPESKVIFGGQPVGPDQGYGPAQLLLPAEVKQIATLLQAQTPEVLSAKYNPKAMESAKVYPVVIWVREGPEALNYLLQFYAQLVAFYKGAAERGDAVLLVVH
jgi:Domain of unknown function (DUF1877)